ncbi:Mu DNA-binding domain-containing protein [Rhodoferax sp. OV413]|uniref:DNA-binding protein n=1 Tax=Rhodoferax sp. OV413 TaxID=1855285 RepID=UPI00088CE416|nr:DNA-binding protein [Rhodoferax sp. OV413]SDO77171.1 Mu DNA-binding domain-containing protein [Rhodoferax sp. OV413]
MSMWISAPDLAGLPGMPSDKTTVLRRAKAERWTARPRTGRGRTGCEYLITNLPEATQQALAAGAAGAVKPTVRAIEAGKQACHVAQV